MTDNGQVERFLRPQLLLLARAVYIRTLTHGIERVKGMLLCCNPV